MAIKLEMDGATFTFETMEEYEAFTKLHNETGEVEVAKEEPIKEGDMVEIIGDTDFYHDHVIGDIGEVIDMDDDDYLVYVDGHEQYVPKYDVKKVDAKQKEEAQKETFYMIKSEYVDTDTDGQRDFKKGADGVLIGNKREADGLVALLIGYEFVGDVIERFDGEVREGRVSFSDEHIYEVTREEFEAKKEAHLAEKDALKEGDIITGNESSSRYTITTDEALMRVISVSEPGESVRVEVIKHVSRPKCEWPSYVVNPAHFDKTTEEEFNAKHGIESKKEAQDVPEGFEKVSFADAKEGDYFLALECGTDIEKGEKYKLYEDYDGDLEFLDEVDDERMLDNRIEDEDGIVIRKIVEEGAQEETQKDSFKEGDRVRVKEAFYHRFPEGTIGTIEKPSYDSTTWIVKTDDESLQGISCLYSGAGTQSIKERELTLVDEGLTIDGDVEVSKVNKIETGDVVRAKTKYKDSFGDSVDKDSFAIVNTVCGDGDIFIKQRMDSRSVLVDAEDVESTLELVAKAIK